MKNAIPLFTPPPVFNPFLLWFEIAMRTTEMLFASGQVINTRVNRMANAGISPSARDRKEFTLMGTEKVKAMSESALAVATRLATSNYAAAGSAWRQWLNAFGESARLANAGLTPIHRKATANARRLAAVKRAPKRSLKGL